MQGYSTVDGTNKTSMFAAVQRARSPNKVLTKYTDL